MNKNPAADALYTLAVAMSGETDTSVEENANDRSKGAKHIPDEVTRDRRKGHLVEFVQETKDPFSWYWLLTAKDQLIPYIDLSKAVPILEDDWSAILSLPWNTVQLEALKAVQQRGGHTLTDSDIDRQRYDLGFFAQWLNDILHDKKLGYRFTNGYERVNNGQHKLVKI